MLNQQDYKCTNPYCDNEAIVVATDGTPPQTVECQKCGGICIPPLDLEKQVEILAWEADHWRNMAYKLAAEAEKE